MDKILTERSAITSLKQKPYIYLPSDKGGEFCVMTKEEYNEAALNHLNDCTEKNRMRSEKQPFSTVLQYGCVALRMRFFPQNFGTIK